MLSAKKYQDALRLAEAVVAEGAEGGMSRTSLLLAQALIDAEVALNGVAYACQKNRGDNCWRSLPSSWHSTWTPCGWST